MTITVPAETIANIRAVSYAVGGVTVEQLVEDSLRTFLFMAPGDILANQESSWTWDDANATAVGRSSTARSALVMLGR